MGGAFLPTRVKTCTHRVLSFVAGQSSRVVSCRMLLIELYIEEIELALSFHKNHVVLGMV